MTQSDDDKEHRFVWPHPGDFGAILFAAVFLAGMIGAVLFLFSSPTPVEDLFGHKPAAQQEKSNEVILDLQNQKK
ncbi:hypothetical protein FHS83_001561 [Rhizomicrobium palustre]|uniref:Uncharacterized protein n=1 Tax=Rhizomicrobium palustre TaxID=189966 RepID=A0A846MY80_9PROT|nr:hypothetical protein [Rhizomicrobium palustre]NIK88243.1 hypothetical protein [Rhizomicrobium palustre]